MLNKTFFLSLSCFTLVKHLAFHKIYSLLQGSHTSWEFGKSWKFELSHSRPGIGWEYGNPHKNVFVGKMTNKIIGTFWRKKWKSYEFWFWKVVLGNGWGWRSEKLGICWFPTCRNPVINTCNCQRLNMPRCRDRF